MCFKQKNCTLNTTNIVVKNIFDLEKEEYTRQKTHLSLISSENLAFPEVLQISSSVLTNKYAEGYPGKRYYSGCKNIDKIENIAIEEAKKLFKCNFANVQSLSGSVANFSIYKAFLKPGDIILGMDLACGGHLTHTSSVSFVSYVYKVCSYSVDSNTNKLNYEEIKKLALEHKPKLIIAGASSYSLEIDFEKFREIADEVGAYLLGDICHLSGLIASDLHKHCFPYCDVAMSTSHKQLRGPRGAVILWNKEEYTAQINKAVFPGTQGGPQPNLIAAKAVAFARCNEPIFKEYYAQVLHNACAMCTHLQKRGCEIVGGSTQTHQFVLNTHKTFGITGDVAEAWLEESHICLNKNVIPKDTVPSKPSGIRIGTLTGTALNFKESDFIIIADAIYDILSSNGAPAVIEKTKQLILGMMKLSVEFGCKCNCV